MSDPVLSSSDLRWPNPAVSGRGRIAAIGGPPRRIGAPGENAAALHERMI